jgi:predicted acetyltransferase
MIGEKFVVPVPGICLRLRHQNEVPVLVELVAATRAHQATLSNLLQFYMYDFSEFISLELGQDGRFEYSQLPFYWIDPMRFPLLAVVDGRHAGFVFVRQVPNSVGEGTIWDMAEFFVMRSYRGQGVGTSLARLAFKRFPGAWQVRVMASNVPACRFWQQAIATFTGTDVLPRRAWLDEVAWDVFTFEAGKSK